MFKFIASTFLFLALLLLTALKPIYLPIEWLDILSDTIVGSLMFDGFFPIVMFIESLLWMMLITFYFVLFRFIMGFISMFTGGGKPEI